MQNRLCVTLLGFWRPMTLAFQLSETFSKIDLNLQSMPPPTMIASAVLLQQIIYQCVHVATRRLKKQDVTTLHRRLEGWTTRDLFKSSTKWSQNVFFPADVLESVSFTSYLQFLHRESENRVTNFCLCLVCHSINSNNFITDRLHTVAENLQWNYRQDPIIIFNPSLWNRPTHL